MNLQSTLLYPINHNSLSHISYYCSSDSDTIIYPNSYEILVYRSFGFTLIITIPFIFIKYLIHGIVLISFVYIFKIVEDKETTSHIIHLCNHPSFVEYNLHIVLLLYYQFYMIENNK